MTSRRKIAVVGSGIAGLSAAWLLAKAHDVTLFEQDGRPGGHSNTVDAPAGPHDQAGAVAVDTGFIVYNVESYPNLIALFDHLGVPTARSNMSFAVSLDDGAYEYSGTGLLGIFGQPANLLRPGHWGMLWDVRRFFADARKLLAADPGDGPGAMPSLGDYLAANGYGAAFIERHILPMAAAIWSAPPARTLAFPAAAFVRFFANHGLLQVRNRPEWRTVTGGSRAYVARLLEDFPGRVRTATPVTRVTRLTHGVTLTSGRGQTETFDACVLATHADQALALLSDADRREERLLGAFGYQDNRAVLHTDPKMMPRRRRVWSSWNYRATGGARVFASAPCITYWMNRLQPLGAVQDLFVTLNPPLNPTPAIDPAHVIAAFDYAHPVFDAAAMTAQRELWSLQGLRRTWFCGSYFGSGFHEDALQAGLAVAEHIGGVRRPWSVAAESGRIHLGVAGKPSIPAVSGLAEAAA
jgi:uncharacterized protein